MRGGPKRTGARTFAQIRAVWERPRFSRWPCRRLGAPASVCSNAGRTGVPRPRLSRGSDIRRLVCPCFVVRRHGLQPAVSDYGCRASSKGTRCGRRGNLAEGRSNRILPRQERSSNRPPPACPAGAEVLVARCTAFPPHVRPRRFFGVRQLIAALVRPASTARQRTSHLSLRFPHRPKRR